MSDTFAAEAKTGQAVVTTAPKPKADLVAGGRVSPIVPRNIEEVARVAQAVIVAGLAPDSYIVRNDPAATAAKIMIGIMKGAEVGFPPLTALASIAIINNRPCIWGDGAVALVQGSGLVDEWEETYEGTPGTEGYTAICSISRRGQSKPYVGKFSLADAKRAHLLTKDPWVKYQFRMLMWRARGYAMRTGFADCLAGLSLAEEVRDMPTAPEAVNSSAFLSDDVGAVTAEVVEAGSDDAPAAKEEAATPSETSQADDAATFSGYVEMLSKVETLAALSELEADVKQWIAGADSRKVFIGNWNSERLSVEKGIRARKT